LTKAELGHFNKAGVTAKKHLAEFTAENIGDIEVGSTFGADIFEEGSSVAVTGFSKGHGFAGTIKRYGFSSGPRSHGTGNVRAPGSIGACSYPGRVFPGKKMPGHYGNKQKTVKNLKLIKVDAESNLLFVKGAVPGAKNSLIKVSK
jgi:large subunit ribosomal protein L3